MGKTNESLAWSFLMSKLQNPYGVAGLMGNLYAESGINPQNLQNSGNKKLGLTDQEYTSRVNNGVISKNKFTNDGFGYGIAQWTYKTRKAKLYEFWLNNFKSFNNGIGDLSMQLEFLWEELQSYKTVLKVLKDAKSIREASDIVLLKYERPADQSEKVQKKRSEYGRMMFEKYSPTAKKKYVKVNAKSVNLRAKPTRIGKVIEVGLKGDLFEFISQDTETGWYEVVMRNGEKGWITNRYTSIVEE